MSFSLSSQFKDSTVLITGHTGFKGAWLSLILHKLGARLIGVSLPLNEQDTNTMTSNVSLLYRRAQLADFFDHEYWVDLNHFDSIEKLVNTHQINYVFHFAAQAIVTTAFQNPLFTFQTNILSTANLLEGLRLSTYTNALTRIFIASSDKVYSHSNGSLPQIMNEQCERYPDDPYGASKAATELVAHTYRTQYALPVVVGRSGNVIGGGDLNAHRIVPDIMRSIYYKKTLSLRNPHHTRPWTHVLDTLLGYLTFSAHNALRPHHSLNFSGQTCNSLTVQTLIEAIQRQMKSSSYDFSCIIENNPPQATCLENPSLHITSALAQEYLDWKPKISFPEMISLTCQWYKECLFESSDMQRIRQLSISQIEPLL